MYSWLLYIEMQYSSPCVKWNKVGHIPGGLISSLLLDQFASNHVLHRIKEARMRLPKPCRVPENPLIGCSLLLWYQTSDAEASCATSALVQQEVVEWSNGEPNFVTNEPHFHSLCLCL